ncbi:MAG TPA: sugar phosphate isomerase/epimerase [Bacteroidales bacterium]|nr:sugar phosphate isomerase/epimerase [Bacteroidales bacterium]
MKRRINTYLFLLLTVVIFGCNTKNETPQWKTGIQTYTFHNFTLTETLEKTEQLGLHYVEAFFFQSLGAGFPDTAYLNFDIPDEYREMLKTKLSEHDITWYASGVAMYDNEGDWNRFFEFASEMGLKLVTVEPALEDLDMVEALAKKYEIEVAIHNHPEPSVYAHPEVLVKALRGRSEWMGVCADIGHWKRVGADPLEAVKQFEGRLKVIHLKDLNEQMEDAAWGTGILPVQEVVEELKRQKFDGLISIEYENFSSSQMDDIQKSLDYLNSL